MVEAPFIWSRNGKYYLFYSANSYEDGRYALGYAVSDSLEGPYTKARGPWQRTADPASNGGHVRTFLVPSTASPSLQARLRCTTSRRMPQ